MDKERLIMLIRNKIVWAIGGSVLIFILAFTVGTNAATVDLEKEKVTYEELSTKIEDLNTKMETKEQELSAIKNNIKEKQNEYDETLEIIAQKDDIKEEARKIERETQAKEKAIEKLDADIKAQETVLASVSGKVKEKEDDPIQLSAGQFIVGSDIPASRYKVVAAGNSGNFVVYSSYGDLKVNTILGNGDFGVKEYVFFAEVGDSIDLANPAKFIPVE
jgi:predicted phage tail protein